MAIFKVKITETLVEEIEVQAESEDAALQKVKDKYQDEEIILTAEDLVFTEYDVEECK